MQKTRNPHSNVAPTLGNYVRSIRAGNVIYVAGCTAVGTPAENDDVIAQADATLNRIQAIVNAEGPNSKPSWSATSRAKTPPAPSSPAPPSPDPTSSSKLNPPSSSNPLRLS